jgi:hypothetical protein
MRRMNTANVVSDDLERVRQLAQSLDCIPDEDLQLLADVEPATTESWRKRGKGPAYVLFGNRFLYPRRAVAEFLEQHVRERRAVPAKSTL